MMRGGMHAGRLAITVVTLIAAAVAASLLGGLHGHSVASAATPQLDSCQVFWDTTLWELGDEPNPALAVYWDERGIDADDVVIYRNGAELSAVDPTRGEFRTTTVPLNQVTHVSIYLRDNGVLGAGRYCGYVYSSPNGSQEQAPPLPAPSSCSVDLVDDVIVFTIEGPDWVNTWDVRNNGVYVSGLNITDGIGTTAKVATLGLGFRQGTQHFSIRSTAGTAPSSLLYCGSIDTGAVTTPEAPPRCIIGESNWIGWDESQRATSYDIFQNGRLVRNVPAGTTAQNMEFIGAGPLFHHSVYARNAAGRSPGTYCGAFDNSPEPGPPGQVSGCSISQNGGFIDVSHPSIGADSYQARVNGTFSGPGGGAYSWVNIPGRIAISSLRGTVHVSIRGVNGANSTGPLTYCGSLQVDLDGNSAPEPAGSCEFQWAGFQGATLSWAPSNDAGYYEVLVDGQIVRVEPGPVSFGVWVPRDRLAPGPVEVSVRAGTAGVGRAAPVSCGTWDF